MAVIQVENAAQMSEMPEEYRQALQHMVLAHTEGELSGSDAYYFGVPFAPNAYERKVLYESAADEMGHYQLGADVLAEMGVDASYMLTTKLDERYHYPSHFMLEANWAERGLTSMLAESAALDHLVEMKAGSYTPLAAICEQTIREESVHINHGKRIVRAMCETKDGRAAVQSVLERKWPQVLDLFGRSNSSRSRLFLKYGLRQKPNEVARQDWAARTRPKLEELGLVVPADHLNRQFQ